jgi:uncharacterized membrane protein YgcG
MSDDDVHDFEMNEPLDFDDTAAEGLLSGNDGGADPELADVLGDMQVAYTSQPPAVGAALAALIGTTEPAEVHRPRRFERMHTSIIVKIATATVTAAFATGGLAAAHALPAPVQDAVSHLGVGSPAHHITEIWTTGTEESTTTVDQTTTSMEPTTTSVTGDTTSTTIDSDDNPGETTTTIADGTTTTTIDNGTTTTIANGTTTTADGHDDHDGTDDSSGDGPVGSGSCDNNSGDNTSCANSGDNGNHDANSSDNRGRDGGHSGDNGGQGGNHSSGGDNNGGSNSGGRDSGGSSGSGAGN